MGKKRTKSVRAIGVPMDLGQRRRGVDMGPSALRYAGLDREIRALGHTFIDAGNLPVPLRYTLTDCSQKNLNAAIHKACSAIYQAGRDSVARGEIPIFLGGDHSLAMGSVGGVSDAEPCGLIWLDAHGDFNTPESTISGNIHGMALAALMGRGPRKMVDIGRPGPKVQGGETVIIGLRELDPAEKRAVAQTEMGIFTMRDIDELGIHRVMTLALKHLEKCRRIHLSLDLDVMTPEIAPGVGTPVPGGLTYREAQLIMEMIAETDRLSSLDIVEINPIFDKQNRTARLAVELLASLLGKTIL